jgi:hypothetical protein
LGLPQVINPDRLINLLEKKAYLKILLLMKELDKSLLKQKMPLGILIDKEFQDIDQVFIPISNQMILF